MVGSLEKFVFLQKIVSMFKGAELRWPHSFAEMGRLEFLGMVESGRGHDVGQGFHHVVMKMECPLALVADIKCSLELGVLGRNTHRAAIGVA